MRLLIRLLLSIVFILNTAMSCDEDYADTVKVNLIGVEAHNVNNEGQNPVISDMPIKKEAYVIGVRQLTDSEVVHVYDLVEPIVSETISCNIDIDKEHPAGTDITNFFVRSYYKGDGLTYSYVLRKEIPAGKYSFKLVVATASKVFETETTPIDVY